MRRTRSTSAKFVGLSLTGTIRHWSCRSRTLRAGLPPSAPRTAAEAWSGVLLLCDQS